MVDNSMSTSNFQDLIHRFDEALCGGLKLCVIARALPGRGKTTLVQKIITHYGDSSEFTAVMSAADDFMVNSLGESNLKMILTIEKTWCSVLIF